MEYSEFDRCIAWWNDRTNNVDAWKVNAAQVLKYDDAGKVLSANLDIKNPSSLEALEHLPPEQLLADILEKEQRVISLLKEMDALLIEPPT